MYLGGGTIGRPDLVRPLGALLGTASPTYSPGEPLGPTGSLTVLNLGPLALGSLGSSSLIAGFIQAGTGCAAGVEVAPGKK